MSKNRFISSSRFVLSLAAAGIVGLSTNHVVSADEVTNTPVSSQENTTVAENVEQAPAVTEAAPVVEAEANEETAETAEETAEEIVENPVTEAPAIESEEVATEEVVTEEDNAEAEPVVEEAAVEETEAEATTDEDTDGDGCVDEITIAHTNDMHGRAEQEDDGVIGISNAAQYYEEIGADVIVDAGDAFQGLPLSNHDEGAAMAEAMNAAGYDAMAVGNHEFDFGQDVATSYQDKTNFPVLSVNTVYEDTQELVFQPSTNIATQGYNLGVVGVTTPETSTKTHPNNVNNVEFLSPIETTVNEITRLIEDDTTIEDAFIVLSHLGVDATTNEEWRATALATALDDVEAFNDYQIILIDGHSHTAYANERYGNVLMQQTGTALNNIGLINLNFADPSKTQGELVAASDVLTTIGYEFDEEGNQVVEGRTNEEVKAIVDEAAAVFGEETGRVIVDENPIWFNGVREYVRSHETNSGTYITDAMVAYGRDGGFVNPTDFAMINGGGIREQIVEGEPITEGDVIAVLPFGNIISQIAVTGETIYDMFELAYSAATVTEPYSSSDGAYTVEAIDEDSQLPSLAALGGFLQVSSDIKIYFDPTLEAGQRVLGVYILDRETGEFELVQNDLSATYYMATNDFLAQGGDGYTMLSGDREEGPSLDRVVMDAMETGSVDLANYADPLPQNQVIPILAANYEALLAESVGETPGEETPGEETPGEETPGEEIPGEEVPGEETPATELPGGETPNVELPSEDTNDGTSETPAASKDETSSSKASNTSSKAESKEEKASKGHDKAETEDPEEVAVAVASTLPNTGYTGGFGLALSAILGGLGLAGFPKRRRK